MAVTRINYYEGPLTSLLTGLDGPVAADLSRRVQRAVNAAKVNASGRPGPNVISGRLRSSITFELGQDAKGLFADFGTNVPYGFFLETGLRNGAKYPFLVPALPALK